MRLSEQQCNIIITASREIFGENIQIYLFGLRVDDSKRGGDIDILVRDIEKIKVPLLLRIFVCSIWAGIGRIVGYATNICPDRAGKKTSKSGILMNSTSLSSQSTVEELSRKSLQLVARL